MFKQKYDWSEKNVAALIVMTSFIATISFQVGVDPPRGVWQDTNTVDAQGNLVSVPHPHNARKSIFAYNYSIGYGQFLITNTT